MFSSSPKTGSNLRDSGRGSQPPEQITNEMVQQASVGVRGSVSHQISNLAHKVEVDGEAFISESSEKEESQTVKRAIYESGQQHESSWLARTKGSTKLKIKIAKRRHHDLVQFGHVGAHRHPWPCLRRIVVHYLFETSMAVLIVANCVVIGWQAELRNPEGTIQVINMILEHVFTFLFTVELTLRAIVFNWTFWVDQENHLDIFLVILSVLNSWILGPAGIEADFLRKASVLRILRLVRIAKSFRRQFKEMWQLLQGIVDSFETLVWTYVMMNIVLYFFAIMATVVFAKMELFDGNEDAEKIAAKLIIDEKFRNVLQSMMTLFQIMTLDSWSDIMRPLMAVHPWSCIFFIVFITISVFLLMNLITSVIVTQAFENGRADEAEKAADLEADKERTVKELKDMFMDMDADGSEQLSRDEIAKAWQNRKVRKKFRTMDIGKKDLNILWEALDDGDGELSIEEFTGGMRKLKGEAKAKDILKLFKQVRILESSIREITILSDYSKDRMNNIKMKLRTTFRELDATRRTLSRIKETAKLASRSQPLCV